MPIEKKSGETREEFISRCVSQEIDAGKPQDQALAICLTYADENFKSATPSVTDNTWSTVAPINVVFNKQRKVIFNEDFDEEVVRQYKDLGFKVYIHSARKIKRKDRKVWNKLKTVGLTEDVLVFGEMKNLQKRYNFDLHMTGQDPILEALKLRGTEIKFKKVLNEYPVTSIEDARQKEVEALSSIDLKFVTVKVVYQYAEIPGIPDAKSGSRPFCKEMMSQNSRSYTLQEIADLPNDHLVEMFSKYNLEPDVFQYRGGFYRLPGTLNTTPWCRHEWRAKVVVV